MTVFQDRLGADNDWENTLLGGGVRGGIAGLPYPGPDDLVADTASAIQALAQAVDNRTPPAFTVLRTQSVTVSGGYADIPCPTLKTVLGAVISPYATTANSGSNPTCVYRFVKDQPVGMCRIQARQLPLTGGLTPAQLWVCGFIWGTPA